MILIIFILLGLSLGLVEGEISSSKVNEVEVDEIVVGVVVVVGMELVLLLKKLF
jgi:hypothetical protein